MSGRKKNLIRIMKFMK